jgi:hypothetical protein
LYESCILSASMEVKHHKMAAIKSSRVHASAVITVLNFGRKG